MSVTPIKTTFMITVVCVAMMERESMRIKIQQGIDIYVTQEFRLLPKNVEYKCPQNGFQMSGTPIKTTGMIVVVCVAITDRLLMVKTDHNNARY